MTTTKVPPLDRMRQMSDAELLTLKTNLSYDRAVIDGQLRFGEQSDPDWTRRAAYAQHVREFGVGAIRNILAERSAQRSDEPAVPLERWLHCMHGVIDASRALLDAEEPEDALWDALEAALERYDDFSVKFSVVGRVVS